MTFDVAQLITLAVGILSSNVLIKLIDRCVERAKNKALNEAAEIDTDVLEAKFRAMLYGENMGLRKDLDEAHDKIRQLQKSLLQAEMTIGDMGRQHQEEMAEVNARLKLTEERLNESEKARAVLQGGPVV